MYSTSVIFALIGFGILYPSATASFHAKGFKAQRKQSGTQGISLWYSSFETNGVRCLVAILCLCGNSSFPASAQILNSGNQPVWKSMYFQYFNQIAMINRVISLSNVDPSCAYISLSLMTIQGHHSVTEVDYLQSHYNFSACTSLLTFHQLIQFLVSLNGYQYARREELVHSIQTCDWPLIFPSEGPRLWYENCSPISKPFRIFLSFVGNRLETYH